jgi:hypothetical protein
MIEEFVRYAGKIAGQYDKKEADALAAGGFGPQGAEDGEGPGDPETDKHSDFENTHGRETTAT